MVMYAACMMTAACCPGSRPGFSQYGQLGQGSELGQGSATNGIKSSLPNELLIPSSLPNFYKSSLPRVLRIHYKSSLPRISSRVLDTAEFIIPSRVMFIT